jgi:hypothetical protein
MYKEIRIPIELMRCVHMNPKISAIKEWVILKIRGFREACSY